MMRSNRPNMNPMREADIFKHAVRYAGLITPQLYLLLILSFWMAHQAWQRNFETLAAVESQQEQQREINLMRSPLTQADMENVANRMRKLSPRLVVATESTGGLPAIRLSIRDAGELDVFRESLMLVQSSTENAIWTASELCFGQCSNGAATATLTAIRQQIEVK